MDVVWEQFVNQVAVTAGEDFIKENRGLHLDLRKEAHITSLAMKIMQSFKSHGHEKEDHSAVARYYELINNQKLQ